MNDMSHTYEDLDEYDAALGKVVIGFLGLIVLIITGVILI